MRRPHGRRPHEAAKPPSPTSEASPILPMISQDIRTALRSLRRTPGFTVVALLTVAIGIGGTTAIFSVVDGILLRPLPYPDPSAIVSLVRRSGNSDALG